MRGGCASSIDWWFSAAHSACPENFVSLASGSNRNHLTLEMNKSGRYCSLWDTAANPILSAKSAEGMCIPTKEFMDRFNSGVAGREGWGYARPIPPPSFSLLGF
jgi:hypothetical protein